MYGFTIDNPWDYKKVVSALRPHKGKISVRIVIDGGVPIEEYRVPFKAISNVAPIMAMIADSSIFKNYSVGEYVERTKKILEVLGSYIRIYEVGNEVNGDWLGVDVTNKIFMAQDVLLAAGKETAITLYSDESESWRNWLEHNSHVVKFTNYLLLSEYPHDNNGYRARFEEFMQVCNRYNKGCYVGYGECGVTGSRKEKLAEFDHYYKEQDQRLKKYRRYIGGYYWWYQVDLSFLLLSLPKIFA